MLLGVPWGRPVREAVPASSSPHGGLRLQQFAAFLIGFVHPDGGQASDAEMDEEQADPREENPGGERDHEEHDPFFQRVKVDSEADAAEEEADEKGDERVFLLRQRLKVFDALGRRMGEVGWGQFQLL